MSDFKINIDPPKVSDEQALKHQDFSKVMASYEAMKLPFYKTLRFWLWTAGGFTALLLLLLFIFNPFEKTEEPYVNEEVIITEENEEVPVVEVNQPEKETELSIIITEDDEEIVLEEKVEKKEYIERDTIVTTHVVKSTTPITEKVEKVIEITPVVYVCGKQSGESVHKMQLGTVGKLTGHVPELNEKLTILSFDMEYSVRGETKKLSSDSYKFTKEMLYATDDMKGGDIVRFRNVKCQTKDGLTFTIDEMSILVEDGMTQW